MRLPLPFLTIYFPGGPPPCQSSPCLNGGICTDVTDFFVCACTTGFSGDTCELGEY